VVFRTPAGTGACTIESGFNVASVTKLATGYYQVNFSPNLGNTNYGASGSAMYDNGAVPSGTTIGTIFAMGVPGGPNAVRTVSQCNFYMLAAVNSMPSDAATVFFEVKSI
jgi:hypothetical protein